MKKYLEILKKCPLFDRVEEESLLRMLNCLGGKVVSFDKKYTVFAEGSRAKYIGILLSGALQIVQLDYYGNRNILSAITPGEVFAEAFACAEIESLPVTVVADEPSEVMLIESSHILHTCSNNCGFHQQLIYNLMKDLAAKTIMFHERIDVTSKRTTREKLLAYLNNQSRRAGGGEFDIPFDRQELADYLEVDRSGLSVEIGKLRREGVIECRKNHFVMI